eukprot:TRINITY_DN17920_c2_g1_i1.p1 TRINITY_DN17920_c2_g1~~TRINITY_DN17920_c2_g1_i1.p1  ORF type:complete len:379 (+),score=106.84 TRINITY_DN17920_c2_g1_i1:147-1283(+)
MSSDPAQGAKPAPRDKKDKKEKADKKEKPKKGDANPPRTAQPQGQAPPSAQPPPPRDPRQRQEQPRAASGADGGMGNAPTDLRVLEKMTKEQLLEEVLQERKRRIHWEKRKKANMAEKARLERMKSYADSIDAKLKELELESELLGIEKDVIAGEFEAQLAAQQAAFCQKVCEMERQMDNREIQWYIESGEMRDDDVIATNEHLLKEDEVLDRLEDMKRRMVHHMGKLKVEKQGFQRKTKLSVIYGERIDFLRKQLEERRAYGESLASDDVSQSSRASRRPPSAHFSHDERSVMSTPGHQTLSASHAVTPDTPNATPPSRSTRHRDPASASPQHRGSGRASRRRRDPQTGVLDDLYDKLFPKGGNPPKGRDTSRGIEI